jgi:hypothetical protein
MLAWSRMTPTIERLPELVDSLPEAAKARFRRLFELNASDGRLVVPAEMRPWIKRQFGSVVEVERQRVVRVTNRWTLEGTLFNALRARRPTTLGGGDELEAQIEASRGDPFCDLETGTPADVFGRVHGESAVTASNVAKYEAWCAVVIFDEHHPLRFTRASVAGAVDTAWRWGQQVHALDPEARLWFFMWNCLWRAGSSIVHGHAQAAMTRCSHFPHIERWHAAARRYGRGYFEALYQAHANLGLGFELDGVRVLAHLTPTKEREVLLIADNLSPGLSSTLYETARLFVDQLGVTAFNVGLYHRPLGRATWRGFPVILRIVDRGPAATRNSDMGAMELFAASIVASDPFQTAQALKDRMVGSAM